MWPIHALPRRKRRRVDKSLTISSLILEVGIRSDWQNLLLMTFRAGTPKGDNRHRFGKASGFRRHAGLIPDVSAAFCMDSTKTGMVQLSATRRR